MRSSARTAAFVLAACMLAATGCGTSDDEAAARSTAGGFFSALERDDGDSACAQLSDNARRKLEDDEGEPCGEAVVALDVGGGRVTRVEVFAMSARVQLASGESAFLSRQRDGWRLTAVGCTPTAPERPFDCEFEL